MFRLSLVAVHDLDQTPKCVRERREKPPGSGLKLYLCPSLVASIRFSDSPSVSANFLIIYKVELMLSIPLIPVESVSWSNEIMNKD